MRFRLVIILFLTVSAFITTYGQNNVDLNMTEASIESQFNSAKELIKNNDFKSYKEGIEIIDVLEIVIENSKDLKLKLAFYRQNLYSCLKITTMKRRFITLTNLLKYLKTQKMIECLGLIMNC